MIGTSPHDEQNEELVAYLDGELSPEEVLRIERRLAGDPEFRRQLQGLQRAWSLLDTLPRSSPSTDFASSTVTMVAQTAAEPRRRTGAWRPWAFGAAAMLALCLASYAATARRLRAADDQFLRDLPVIQNVDMYRHVEDIEFLRQLIDDGLFAGDESDA